MRICCNVQWLDGEVCKVVVLVNTVSYRFGVLSIYLVENSETYFELEVTIYDYLSIQRCLVEDGYAYISKTVYEKLWNQEDVK